MKLLRALWQFSWPFFVSFIVCGWVYHAGYERGVAQTKAAIFDVLNRMEAE